MDIKLKQLEAENRMLLTQKSQEELERLHLKKQSMTLQLRHTTGTTDVQTDTLGLPDGAKTSGTETCDTFHTANSDCSFASALPSPFPPRAESHQTPASDISELPEDGKALMSDSGVCLDAKLQEPPTTSTAVVHPIIRNCFYEQLLQSQMLKLREEIAGKKAEIMKMLETGGKKSTLDEMINELEELQKEYVKLEMRLEASRGKDFSLPSANHKLFPSPSSTDGCISDGETSTELRSEANGCSTTDSDESRHHNPLAMSSMSTRNNSLTASVFAQHIMTRSLPTIEGSFQSQSLREYKTRRRREAFFD
jgi:hypothetical protein